MTQSHHHARKTLQIGQQFYLCGSATKVEIVDHPDYKSPTCRILAIGQSSKYQIGQIVNINRQILYTFHGRNGQLVVKQYGNVQR